MAFGHRPVSIRPPDNSGQAMECAATTRSPWRYSPTCPETLDFEPAHGPSARKSARIKRWNAPSAVQKGTVLYSLRLLAEQCEHRHNRRHTCAKDEEHSPAVGRARRSHRDGRRRLRSQCRDASYSSRAGVSCCRVGRALSRASGSHRPRGGRTEALGERPRGQLLSCLCERRSRSQCGWRSVDRLAPAEG